jgi:hypothetical protein
MSPPELGYVAVKVVKDRVVLVFLRDLERALERAGLSRFCNQPFGAFVFAAKVLARLGLVRNFARRGPKYIVPVMDVHEQRYFPISYLHEVIPYCFDCWERRYPLWQKSFQRQRVRVAFFSARQSAEYFQRVMPNMHSVWLPEACDPAAYDPKALLANRGIDVLELGRRHNAFHDAITPVLAAAGRVHLYEKEKGRLIFPSRTTMLSGLANSKISVCFPGSMTHKDWAGDVETVTWRYFESMASKCLIVGHCPAELKTLFGYDPTIPIDMQRPASQIEDLIVNIGNYQELVDHNYQNLAKCGTWDARVQEMFQNLKERGLLKGRVS